MCGIFGILAPRPSLSHIQSALQALRHRGPDGQGHWIGRGIGLGHTRLAMVDLEGGAQPLFSEDGQVVAVVNGEFYGHRTLRKTLEQRGHRFATRSDAEVLIHLYQDHGIDALKHLRGEFAFLLWDVARRRLFAARDRFGVKPLRYAQTPDGWAFASEAKALFAAGVPHALDPDALHQCLHAQYLLPSQTLFQGIHQIPPGHVLTLSEGESPKVVPYWDLDYPITPEIVSDEEATHRVRHQLEEAVRLRLDADVEIGAYLSGGIDSGAILAMATHISGRPFQAFTLSFGDDAYDELPLTRQMADHVGARLHVVRPTPEDLLGHMPAAIWSGEAPVINGHQTAKWMLSRAVRDAGLKAVLVGEGSDELFAGYPHLRQDLWQSDPERLQQLQRKETVSRGIFLATGDRLPTHAIEQALGYTPSFLRAKASLGMRVHRLLHPDAFPPRDAYAHLIQAYDLPTQLHGRPHVHQSMYLWTKTSLANYILTLVGDATEMAHGIEGRVPMLDHHLSQVLTRLPVHHKIRGTVEKHILREATRDLLPPVIANRTKHALLTPPTGAHPAVREQVRAHLTSSKLPSCFDPKAITHLLDNLDTMTPQARALEEPALMMALSLTMLSEAP